MVPEETTCQSQDQYQCYGWSAAPCGSVTSRDTQPRQAMDYSHKAPRHRLLVGHPGTLASEQHYLWSKEHGLPAASLPSASVLLLLCFMDRWCWTGKQSRLHPREDMENGIQQETVLECTSVSATVQYCLFNHTCGLHFVSPPILPQA